MNRSSACYTAAASVLCFALAASPVSAAMNDFTGVWKNTDPAAGYLSRLDIRREGGELVIHAWGKCRPNDCGWGAVHARLYSSNIAVTVAAGADTAISEFERGGVQRMLMLQLNSGQINYSTYTLFRNSRGNNYHTQGRLTRQ